MRDIAREFDVDPRVMAIDNTDGAQLVANKMTASSDIGFDFTGLEDDEDIEIDDI